MIRHRSALALLFLLTLAGVVVAHQMRQQVRVDESVTRLEMRPEGARLELVVENPRAEALTAQVRVELLAHDSDGVIYAAHAEPRLARGANRVPLLLMMSDVQGALVWQRLRYYVAAGGERTQGIVAVSEIAPDLFDLRVAAPRALDPTQPLRLRVRTFHPVKDTGITGVPLEATVKFEDDGDQGLEITRRATTGADGYALLTFDVPAWAADADMRVSAQRGFYARSAATSVERDARSRFLLSTDKPIYQPGQTLHLRALALDATRRARAGTELLFTIEDSSSDTTFRRTVETSRFGVAHTEWQIPESARNGPYRIRVECNESGCEGEALAQVRVSRYELPKFTVNVKTDRPYYLPGQKASVEVSAEYLFGEPVKQGRVRVVRQEYRYWGSDGEEWESDEGDEQLGNTQDGVYRLELDLEDHFEDINHYTRFADIIFAAYFTDPTSGRTEPRRFAIRVTREPIHVYLISTRDEATMPPSVSLLVSASYADGTPASVELDVREAAGNVYDLRGLQAVNASERLSTVRTNRFGLARVEGLRFPPDLEGYDRMTVVLSARDERGHIGTTVEGVYAGRPNAVRVTTSRNIYAPGEPLDVSLRARSARAGIVLEVVREEKVLASRLVRVVGGGARLLIPYQPEFRGEVTLRAYSLVNEDSGRYHWDYRWPVYDSRTVVFPAGDDLQVDVRPSRAEYRPGDEAALELRVRDSAGAPAESALGLVVFDKAVEERARTDADFQGRYGFYDWKDSSEIAGVKRADLSRLDPTRPLPEGMDLVVEALLSSGYAWDEGPEVFGGYSLDSDKARSAFAAAAARILEPVRNTLAAAYEKSATHPVDDESLAQILASARLRLTDIRDPWAGEFWPDFSYERDLQFLRLYSAGPDKKRGTDDDFAAFSMSWRYLRSVGEAIERAMETFQKRTAQPLFDVDALKQELRAGGVDFEVLRDPWGRRYRLEFSLSGKFTVVRVISSGPDRRFGTHDDFNAWWQPYDYFWQLRERIGDALREHFKETGVFPQEERQLAEALKRAGLDWQTMADPAKRPFYAAFSQKASYRDRLLIRQTLQGRLEESVPITRQTSLLTIRGSGPDGKRGTNDDAEMAFYYRTLTEQSASDAAPLKVWWDIPLDSGSGLIAGTVVDPAGAVIPGAEVVVRNEASGQSFKATTDEAGNFALRVSPGVYRVTATAEGFTVNVIAGLRVLPARASHVEIRLDVGAVAEMVEVSAAAASIDVVQAMVSGARATGGRIGTQTQLSTPRLREFFPETLLWQPNLETGPSGRARVNFKLADNITTWKMSVIASTEDGRIQTAERELRAFLPFFVEHDPPPVLTEGDRIALPVLVRNYLPQWQTVRMEIKPEDWFELEGAPEGELRVAAGDAAQHVFPFRAARSVRAGKQRITARNREVGDAVEKPVHVHPDGREMVQSAAGFLGPRADLSLALPELVAGSLRAEVKVYPGLMAHVAEGIEGIMRRPYGCAEQTISSSYPSLLMLELLEKQQEKEGALARTARRYLRAGVDRLAGYRREDGSYGYWHTGDADLPLTAYALEFLTEARAFEDVDEAALAATRDFLLRSQERDGSWKPRYYYATMPASYLASNTAYVTRVLAAGAPENPPEPVAAALRRAAQYLSAQSLRDPYVIASSVLALHAAGEAKLAAAQAQSLRELAKSEAGGTYWNLESNTLFYGWGFAGRIETTAIALQALSVAGGEPAAEDELFHRGLLFLLQKKDRYGVWYSTQTTVRVLQALIHLLPPAAGLPESGLALLINGREVPVAPAPGDDPLSPLLLDVSSHLKPGANSVVWRGADKVSATSAQLVATYYVPWSASQAPAAPPAVPEDQLALYRPAADEESRALALSVSYDRTQTVTGRDIEVTVKAERIGHHGYGMLLAEIGLPPGAEVDRASLEAASRDSAVQHYEIQPDRVVLYLWPHAGGTTFRFKFRPRFAVDALAAPSSLYDYYNPEAHAVVRPERFIVTAPQKGALAATK